MLLKNLRLRWQDGIRIEIWQKHPNGYTLGFTLTSGEVQIDDIPREDLEVMHGSVSAALDLPCRPRTYEEILAGKRAHSLWTLTRHYEDEVLVTVHASENDALDELRRVECVPHEIPQDETLAWFDGKWPGVGLDEHDLPEGLSLTS